MCVRVRACAVSNALVLFLPSPDPPVPCSSLWHSARMTLVKPGELGNWQDVKGMELTNALACAPHAPRFWTLAALLLVSSLHEFGRDGAKCACAQHLLDVKALVSNCLRHLPKATAARVKDWARVLRRCSAGTRGFTDGTRISAKRWRSSRVHSVILLASVWWRRNSNYAALLPGVGLRRAQAWMPSLPVHFSCNLACTS